MFFRTESKMANRSLLEISDKPDPKNQKVDIKQPNKPKIDEEKKDKIKRELLKVQEEDFDDLHNLSSILEEKKS